MVFKSKFLQVVALALLFLWQLTLCQSYPETQARFRVLEEPRQDTLIGSGDLNTRGILSPRLGIFEQTNENSPRFVQGTKTRRTKPRPRSTQSPIRRQDEGPEFELTSVSPIQSSLGGLTGLQGLPPLSLIQFVKLLVAVTPFILPIIFVPLLIFTVGMFMIPVDKNKIFLGDPQIRKNSESSWTSFSNGIVPSITKFAQSVANHEECFERFVCEIGKRYIPDKKNIIGKSDTESNTDKAWLNKQTVIRILNYFNHPLMHRIARSIQIPLEVCNTRKCGPTSFLQRLMR